MKHSRYPGSLSIHSLALLAVALCSNLALPAFSDSEIPIPETRRELSRAEQQRVRYENSALLDLAHKRIAEEDYAGAEQTLAQVIDNDPDNNHTRVMLFRVRVQLGHDELARELADELLALYPDYYALRLERAFIHLRGAQWERAAEDLEQFGTDAPPDHPYQEAALQQRAEIAFRLGRPAEAAALMRNLLARDDTAERRAFLAECAIALEHWAEAATELRAALQRTDNPAMRALLNLKRGFALFNLDQYAEADDALAQAALFYDSPPELLDILRQRGLLAYREERFAAAAAFYSRHLDHAFDEAVALSLLDALQQADEHVEALRAGQAFAAREGTSAAFLLNVRERLLDLYILQEDHAKAMEAAELLHQETGELRFLRIAATAAAEAGRLEEASSLFRAFLSLSYDADAALSFHYVLRKRGEALHAEGRPEGEVRALLAESIPFLTRMIEDTDTPQHLRQTARYELAGLYRARRELDAAASLLKALVEDPSAPLPLRHTARYELALIHREQRNTDAAAALLKALIVDPDVPADLQRSARYELAQIARTRGEMDAYASLMQALIADLPEGLLLYEYAMHLYGSGRYDQAEVHLSQAFDVLEDPALLYQVCKAMSDIHLVRHQPAEAIRWLEQGREYGEPDRYWQLNMARAEYQLERYDDTIARLLPIAGDEDLFHMYIGFSFYNRMPQMPGLALEHMNRVGEPDRLAKEEQFNFFANRAYLHFDQHMDAQALDDIGQALARHPSRNLELVRLRAFLRSGLFNEVLDRGRELVDAPVPARAPEGWPPSPTAAQPEEPDAASDAENSAFLGQVLEVMGTASYRMEQWRDAAIQLSQALELNPDLLQARYLRGLSHARLGELDEAREDFLALAEQADRFPGTFLGDLAFLLGDLEEYESGTAWMDRSLERYPFDIDAWQERGYQSMKDHRNRDARESFAAAIRLYDEILPYVEPDQEAETYEETRLSLKQEYTKLDKVWSVQLYGQRTDFDFSESALPQGVPAESTRGALLSQGGASIGYRPPRIGFRDEKTLDLFVRVLANLEPDSWQPDEDSYQGGLGLMYKPFTRHNYLFGFERLFKIGSNSEDNWLWRNTYGLEGGERPPRHQEVWLYRRLYGEASYYLEAPRRWVYVGQGQIGPSYALKRNLLLTFPEALVYGRYQDDDPSGVGTYWYYGPGLNISLLEGERELTRDRWSLSGYAHYVWGRFEKAPDGLDDNDFEGWIIGIRFTR